MATSKRVKSLTTWLLLPLVGLLCSSCAGFLPQLTPKERKQLADSALPYTTDAVFDEALDSMGEHINSEVDYVRIIQPKPIGNTAGGDELPFNLTNMVITSLSHMAGRRLVVAPYDPVFISNDAETGGRGSRVLPDLILAGSITEFDKEVDASSRDINLDILVGGGDTETDIGLGANRGLKMSRITLDLFLLEYKTHAVIPGVSVSNTANVIELERGRSFGFAIYGSGLGISGRIKHTQGFHRAVRNLIDYSVLQLMGRYYNLPYWQTLGLKKPDEEVLASLKRSFERRSKARQVLAIQRLLNRAELGEVSDPKSGREIPRLVLDGIMGRKTEAYVEAFAQKYGLKFKSEDLTAIYLALMEHETLKVPDQPPMPNVEKGKVTDVQKFYDRLDRVDKVYTKPQTPAPGVDGQ